MSQRNVSNVSNVTVSNTNQRKTVLMRQASRLALRSSVAVGAAAVFSLLAPDAAFAACTQVGSDVTCDSTVTIDTVAPVSAPNDRGYQVNDNAGASLTVTAGSTVSGRGLAIQNDGTGPVTVINDGAIEVSGPNSASSLGSAALAITANGGDIDYSGAGSVTNNAGGDGLSATQNGMGNLTLHVGGNVAAANGNGINASNAGISGDIDITVDGSINASGPGVAGILVNSLSTSGNVGITANGPITSSGRGISATSNGGSITAVTGAITAGTGAGVELIQSNNIGGGSLLLTTNGNVSGANGILAFNSGTGDISIVAGGKVTGTTGLGINAQGNGGIAISVADTVTGATGGLNVSANAASTSDIDISGTGGFVGLNGIGAFINNLGTGSVLFNISGASSATGATGIRVLDQQSAGVVSVRTGAVTATGATSDGVFVSTQSLTADMFITTDGAISAGRTGIVGSIGNVNATGDIAVFANSSVSGLVGIDVNNQGSGRTQILALGPVTASSTGIGVNAIGRAGDISVDTRAVTATGNTAVLVRRTDNSTAGEVFVFTRGPILGIRGIEASNANGNLSISTSGTVTGTAGSAIIGNATDLVVVSVGGNVTARDYGVYTQSGSSGISILSGTTQGQTGVFFQGNGTSVSTSLGVEAGASVVGTTEYGAFFQPSNSVVVVNNGRIQGVLGALRINSAATATSQTSVVGSGDFIATNGSAIRIDQLGIMGTVVDVSGSISATNGSGVLINQVANSGNVTVRTGAVTATGAGSYGIVVDTASTGSSIGIVASGPVSGTLNGIYANLQSAAATGNIGIVTGAVSGGFCGLCANTNGAGFVSVTANGAVSGTDRGIEAISNGGAVSVSTNSATATTGVGVVAVQRSAASSAVVNLQTNGQVQGAIGLFASNAGSGDLWVFTRDLVTGTAGNGASIFGGGKVTVTLDKTIRGATNGMEISAGTLVSGSVLVTGAGGFVGQNGHGLRIDNTSNGSIAVLIDGATSANNGSGYFLNNATNSGGMLIRTGNIDITGSNAGIGVDAASRSLTGSVQILSLGAINSSGSGLLGRLQTAGATGFVRIDNFGAINAAQLGIIASNSGSGTVEIYNNGSVTAANQAISSSLNGGNFRLDNGGTINGNISVSGSNIAGSAFTNLANATWNSGTASSTLASTLSNAGIINVGTGSVTIRGTVTNSNRINFVGSGPFNAQAGFTNSGVINAQNNATGNVLAVTGNYAGGGQFLVDYNTGTATADRMTVTGNATGTTVVGLTRTGLGVLPTGFLPIVTVNGAAADNAFVTSNVFGTTGFLLESFGRNPVNAQQFGVLQQVNADATDLGGMQTLAATVAPLLDDPISNVVNVKKDPSPNAKQFGLWLRGATADSDQDIATQISSGGITQSTNRSYKINQKAIQGGADFGLLNMGGNGWNLHLGVTAGAGGAKARATVGAVRYEYDTSFVGGYVFLTKDGFTLDAALRHEWRKYSLASSGLFGNGIAHDADGSAMAGSVNASWKLGKDQGFSVTPHVGYSFASAKMDALAIDAMSTLVAHKDKSSVGSVGAKLAYGIDVGGWQLTPYVDVSGLKNWSNGEQGTVLFTGGGSTNFAVESATFRDALRYSGGFMLRDATGRFSAFAAAARTDGSGVQSTAFSIGARINF